MVLISAGLVLSAHDTLFFAANQKASFLLTLVADAFLQPRFLPLVKMASRKRKHPEQKTKLSAFFSLSQESNKNDEKPVSSETDQPSTSKELRTCEEEMHSKLQPTSSLPKRKFQAKWLTDFEWLVYDEERNVMTCKYCTIKIHSAGNTDFISGCTTFKRESLTAHSKSRRHKVCQESVLGAKTSVEDSPIAVGFCKQDELDEKAKQYELSVKMNTAYCIAKEELSFTHMRPLVLLQKKNGLDITPTYDNDVRCAELISTIARDLQEESASQIKECNYISIMIDGATDSSVTENEAVYVRYVEDGVPVNHLISLTEVSYAHADGVLECINSSMEKFGLQKWRDKLVGFCADGASVNLGQVSGVVSKLREDNPKLIDIHCMAHRLELAVLGVLRKVKMVETVNDTLHLIWKTYHFSPKSKGELQTVCEELATRFYKPKPVKGTRWIPHLDRALKIFLKGQDDLVTKGGEYSAVAIHMENLKETSRNADVAGRGKKVSDTMKDLKFAAFCHFLADVFQEISKLSLLLQSKDLILPCAIDGVESCFTSLDAMKTDPFPDGLLETFITQCLEKQTHGVHTSFQGLEMKGDRNSVVENLKPHMKNVCEVAEEHLHSRFDNLLGVNKDQGAQAAVSAFSIFHHDKWPANRSSLELLHGNKELKVLTEWFGDKLLQAECDVEKLPGEWRDFKKCVSNNFSEKSYLDLYQMLLTKKPYRDSFKNILHLVQILFSLPISSANCERAFSAQKRIKSSTRSSMSTSRLSDLIVISTEGPELEQFDPASAMKKWNASGRRKPFAKAWEEGEVKMTKPQ